MLSNLTDSFFNSDLPNIFSIIYLNYTDFVIEVEALNLNFQGIASPAFHTTEQYGVARGSEAIAFEEKKSFYQRFQCITKYDSTRIGL